MRLSIQSVSHTITFACLLFSNFHPFRLAVQSSFGPSAPLLNESHSTRSSAVPTMLLPKPFIPSAITSNPSPPYKSSPSPDLHLSATPTLHRSASRAAPSKDSHGTATETTSPAKYPLASNISASDPSGSTIPPALDNDPFKLMGNASAAAPSSTQDEDEILEHQQVWWAGRARIDHKQVFSFLLLRAD